MSIVEKNGNQYFGFDPRTFPGCQLWLDAADTSTMTPSNPTNGTALSQWNDKSGNNYHATQSTSGNRPLYSVTNTRIDFTRTSSHFFNLPVNALPSGNSSYAYFIVMAWASLSDGLGVIGGGNYGTTSGVFALRSLNTDGRIHHYWWANDLSTGAGAYSANVKLLVEATYTAGGTRATLTNGTQLVSSTPGTRSQGTGNNTVGVTNLSPGPGEYLNGYIQEIIVYNTSLTQFQRQQVEGYLAWKWGIQTNLPTSHPYKPNPNFQRIPQPPDFGSMLFWWDAAEYSSFTPANPTNGTSITGWTDKINGVTLSNVNVSPTWSPNGVVFTNPSSLVSASTQNLVYSNTSSPYTITQNFTIFVAHAPNSFTGYRAPFHMIAPAAFNTNPSFTGVVQNGASEGNWVGAFNGSTSNWITFQQAAYVLTTAGAPRVDTILSAPSNFTWTNGTENTYSINNIGRGTTVSGTATITALLMSTTTTLGGNRVYDGKIFEVLVYNTNLSFDAIRQVEGYLAWKWGAYRNLVSTHPFYNIPTSSPLFTPLNLSNLSLWLDGSDPSTITGTTTVTQWSDKSENGRNATASANYPSYTSGTNYIQMSGSSWFDAPLTFLVSTQYTLFFAVKRESSKVENFFMSSMDTTTNANLHIGLSPDTATIKYAQWANQVSPNPTVTAYTGNTATEPDNLFSFQQTSNQRIVYVNGVNISATSNTSLVAAQNSGKLGVYQTSPTTAWQGRFYEVIMFNRALSTAERQQVEGYLAWKYNFQTRLSTTHPYYKFRP